MYASYPLRSPVFVTFAVFAALGATACQSVSNSLTPDVVYYNGKIATVNAKFEMVQAVAVSEG